MGWKDWRSEDAESVETITETVKKMHDDEARDRDENSGSK
jgi:hypothetical protein